MRSLSTLFVISAAFLQHSLDAADWSSNNLGTPQVSGAIRTNDSGGLVLTGSGPGFGLRRDDGFFAAIVEPGDFDYAVRVDSLAAPDFYGRAGLMARSSLEADGPFVGVMATPSVAGTLFQARQLAGTIGRQAGGTPAAFPEAWLRLQRSGDTLTGATSVDGRHWTKLDTATLTSSAGLYVGLAVTSWSSNEVATAVFRDWHAISGPIGPAKAPPVELPGPTTRRTELVISEIMYHPAARDDGRNLEFVEIFNAHSLFAELGGFRLSGAVEFTIPEGTVLRPGGFLVVARVPADVQAVYGLTNVVGGYTNGLANSSGVVRLLNPSGAVFLEANYDSRPPWPASTDGAGHSLVLARPSYGERDVRAWTASSLKGGSPGHWDYPSQDALSQVVINEVRARASGSEPDFIEVYNHGSETVDLSGTFLSDNVATNRYRVPAGTKLAPGAFLALEGGTLGFGLDASGETIFLVAPDNSRVIDAMRFGPQPANGSYGRTPDGAASTGFLTQATPGRSNAPRLVPDVVINEIMYHPVSENDADEYVELYNRGTTAVNLSGWQFTQGIAYTFPVGATLPPGGYLVVAKDASRMLSQYPHLRASTCLGNFAGSLSGKGERIALARPETVSSPAGNGSQTLLVEVAAVTYASGGQWGRWSDGGGSSLELIDARADAALAPNWADSNEAAKGEWTQLEHTGVLDNGNPVFGINQLQVLMEGVGECLLDNVEVIGPGGTNLLVNGDFESGMSGWTAQGSHRDSTVEAGLGVNGSQCLHVRADSRGDPGANRIRANLPLGLQEGQTVTLRAQARWLRGFPGVLVRLRGNYLELDGPLRTSAVLGTPGRPNSQVLSNAPPAIYDVGHAPILPAADQAVVVTARGSDPDGIGLFTLRYRVDPSPTLIDLPMHDDGTEGDQVAGDGLWSATIPGQPLNALVAFQVAATDAAAQPATSTFPVAAPARECLVRFGEPQPGGTFGTYRIWMTQATRTRWSTREKLNNAPLDVTFVYGNQRVIYNAGSLYTGSPFVSPGYTGPTTAPLCGYAVHFPSDDLFLGADEMKLDWPVRDNTLQMEQVAYWIAGQMGLPSNHRRFVFLYVNGVKRGNVYEDSQQPNSDMVAQYFPDDSDGDLYKIDDWFEFDNAAANFGNQNVDASLDDFTTTGGEKKTARYRWNFRKRAVKQSASDYRSLFALVDATRFNSADAAQRVEAVMDLDKYLGIVAMEHVVGNWDSFGYSRGKNMQTYKPQRGKWHLLAWDIDFVLNAESDPSDAYLFATRDQTIAQMMFYPPSQRAYLRALATAAEGPLTPARFSPVLAGNYAALLANGITPSFYGGSSNYMTRRATYIKQQLADYNTAFALSSNVTTIATPDSTLLLQGTAPVQVREIQVDGVAYPIVWADATHWQMAVPLQSRSSQLQIAALDGRGRPLGQTKTLQVNSSASFQDPAGQIVFNEIMYRPSVPLGDYIEFYNRSATEGFDLSGWQVQGVNYTFPAGSLLPPSSFLVLARDPAAFWQAYGPDAVPAGYFQVDLNRDRATLRLLRPGGTPSTNRTVAEVSYSSTLPWPAEASEGGISLQLRDPNQAQDRVGNWSAKRPGAPAEWDLVSVTAPAGSSKLLVYLSSLPPVRDVTSIAGVWDLGINFGGGSSPYRTEFRTNATGGWEGDFIFLGQGQEQRSSLATVGITNDILVFGFSEQQPEFRFTLGTNPLQMTGQFQQPDRSYASTLKRYNPGGDAYIDDLWLNNGAEPRGGVNLLANGDFESTLSASWSLGTNLTRSRIESGLSKSGDSSLHLIATTGGFDERTALWQEVSAVQPGQLYTLSFWLRRGTNAAGLVARMADWSLATARDLRPVKNKPISFTPGEPNSTLTQLTELPRLWLNELAPVNINGPADRQGQRSPWLELYNAGTNPIPLGDFLLGDSQAAANPWAFPANAAIAPGAYHLVWLDGNPSQSTESEWHAGFRPDPSQGVVVLWRREGQELRVVDFVDYTSLPTGHSIGWASDGVPTERWTFAQPTPAQPNTTTATVAVFINEWMAANDRTWSDPADDDFEDWFELYNAGTARADLSGYLLSDTVADPRKFVVPPGTTIAPHGYLLVWADGEPGQNRPGDDLHVNFKLSASGESILLSNPSGAQVDLVTFGPQPQEEAEGRWPDGAAGSFRLLTEPTPGEANVWNEDLRLAAIRQTASGKIETYWPSIAGQQFRVQSKDDLNAAAWVDIDQPITAVGPETSITISSPPTGQRFFRVLILQP